MHPESKLRLMTLQGDDLEFPVGIGMRKADTDLKEGVDEVLQRLGQRHVVTDILARYGVPLPSPQAAAHQPVKAADTRRARRSPTLVKRSTARAVPSATVRDAKAVPSPRI